MGKATKKSSKEAAATPNNNKCTCDHPFTCTCGNRPPRPSKGHKWYSETQEWAGKGHKQKGASGQIASVAQQATTTQVGKTKIEQWQRLPSTLLKEYCQRQKRPPVRYDKLSNCKSSDKYRYRVVLADGKNSDKDLLFAPQESVANEEQAKEEAALLALLSVTPNLPHERKLPEPYKATWLHAVAALKDAAAKTKPSKATNQTDAKAPAAADDNQYDSNVSSATTTTTANASTNAAQASTRLVSATTFTSTAERRKQKDEQRRQRNARIRHHEAVRLANLPHRVFMSAVVRRQIEALLRGEEISVQSMNDEEEEDGGDEQEEDEGTGDDVGAYVLQRLVHEGFSKKQARRAMRATREDNKNTAIGEEDWDDRYESCLQWLLIHLNEDQLPEGLDPRGTMLDVIAAPKKAVSKDHDTFAKLYNVSTNDAAAVAKKAAECGKTMDAVFWETLIERSGVARFRQAEPEIDQAANLELLNEEIEAVKAIYDSACTIDRSESSTSFTVELPGTKLRLHVIVSNGAYPVIWPSQVLVSGEWPAFIPVGVALHVAIIDFISENLLAGELFVLAIFGHVQELLDRIDELPETTLQTDHQSTMIEVAGASAMEVFDNKSNTSKSGAFAESSLSRRRPRERSKFWSVPPNKTVSATAFPKISILLDKTRKALPAAAARNEFLTKLDNCSEAGSVMLVTGETGCGKTTQLCQFILEALPKDAKIVVAQPRRLAATGVAARVAEERGEERPGVSSVGYVVRGDSSICDKSRLVFCTTGILLRQLQNDNSLDCITHILVDEVHERNLDTDVLLGLLKQMRSVYPRLKIILMSATIDADRMAAYWGTGTPRMHIPGRTFPVSNFTLEDVLKLTHGADEDSVHELCERVKTLDYELIGRLVNYLVLNNEGPKDGSILVFLPGAPEISKAIEAVKRRTEGLSVVLLALHGGLQPKEQNRVFLPAPSGQTKVIFSTNIAETSVTIPDCTIVIDTCREKQSSYDPSNRMPLLVEQYASRSSLEQRRGRAGRVREGTCYKLISRQTLASLNQHAEPEIRRCALDQTLLSLLFLGVEQGFGSFMNTLLDPPSPESMQAAAHSLKLIGTVEPGATPDTLRLTPLGTLVAGIPAPPIVGKRKSYPMFFLINTFPSLKPVAHVLQSLSWGPS
jgi:HrpA-like RNA helicase